MQIKYIQRTKKENTTSNNGLNPVIVTLTAIALVCAIIFFAYKRMIYELVLVVIIAMAFTINIIRAHIVSKGKRGCTLDKIMRVMLYILFLAYAIFGILFL